ncbi:MAG: hypothetical protein NUW01_03465 [Gemmatimonadaceae bacterium]|nr:hypothetical protein [Gemmatimonadaceae bacterium]
MGKWLRSKTLWGAVIVAVGSVVRAVKPQWGPAVDAIIGVGVGLGLVGVKHAVEKTRG